MGGMCGERETEREAHTDDTAHHENVRVNSYGDRRIRDWYVMAVTIGQCFSNSQLQPTNHDAGTKASQTSQSYNLRHSDLY